jgi:hypothetical protein
MSNSPAISTSFKVDLLNGLHAFGASVVRGATTKDNFKAALYFSTATITAATTAYTATGEVTGTGYTAGGVAVTNATAPTSSGTTAFWTPSAAFAWTTLTISSAFNTVLTYNDTAAGKNAVASYGFSDQTVTAANFSLTMPTNDATFALLRLA